ncbi:sortase [Nocardioides sp. GCM10027113]|uniref:sortase n=1 Tax=unclassified Nocardioides TaxID=2615069 RepID=UPI003608914D
MWRRRLAVACVLVGTALLLTVLVRVVSDEHRAARAQLALAARVPAGAAVPYEAVPGAPLPVRSEADAPVARAVPVGDALAVLRIPRLGDDWSWVVVEGVEADQLAQGVGHYPGTALPGATGNVGLAGHRLGHGSPFLQFDDLEVGDRVIVEQGSTTWVYRLTTPPRRVPADAVWVLDQRDRAEITLTTCWPLWGSAERLYVTGELEQVR